MAAFAAKKYEFSDNFRYNLVYTSAARLAQLYLMGWIYCLVPKLATKTVLDSWLWMSRMGNLLRQLNKSASQFLRNPKVPRTARYRGTFFLAACPNKVTFSDPKMTYSYPKVTYSDPKVTHSDPTHLPLPPPASPKPHLAIS